MTPYDKYISYPDSLTRTVQEWSTKDLDHDRWANALVEIVGLAEKPVFEQVAEARMFFLYSLEHLFNGDMAHPEVIWEDITRKAETLEKAMPWVFRDEEDDAPESNLSAPKKVKTRKKTQQECAKDFWIENLSTLKGMTPKAIQDRMSEECDIHRNSCRGIYYKLKKELPFA